MKFELGQIVATPGAIDLLGEEGIRSAIGLYSLGSYWGELDEEDIQANEEALETGGRLFASYSTENGEKFWIITEWDRSVTTVLLPEEY